MNPIEKFKETCREYLVINDDSYIDIIFGTYFANFLDSSPVWLYLIGPPGGGKTEVVQALGGYFNPEGKYVLEDSPTVVMRDTITTNSLISGYIPKNKKDQDINFSLMPQLDGKLFIIKDFTLMLKMRRETFHEILGQFRAAYDGYLSKQVGQGEKSAVAKFGLIACVTSQIDHHRQLLTSLGERCLSFRLPEVTSYEAKKRGMKATDGHLSSEQRLTLAKAAHKLMELDPVVPTITTQQRKQIINMAVIIAKARTEVARDTRTKEPDIPEIEVPTRLSIQLVNLTLGVTMARNKETVGSEEIALILRMALHSISPKRLRLFKSLLLHYPNDIPCSEIAEEMRFSETAVDTWLDDLWLLGLVNRRTVLKTIAETKRVTTCHLWQLSDAKLLKKVLQVELEME